MSGKILRKLKAALVGGTLLGAGGLFWAREVETRWLEVVPVTLALPRLAPEFDGYRVVQIGDLHLEDWTKPRRIERIVNLVNDQRADLIAITGDFLSYSANPGVPLRLTEALRKTGSPGRRAGDNRQPRLPDGYRHGSPLSARSRHYRASQRRSYPEARGCRAPLRRHRRRYGGPESPGPGAR